MHTGCEKYISTQRNDRTGVDRANLGQMEPVTMEMDANIQSLIDISRKRLCSSADPTTREYWISLMDEIKELDESIYWACVPECVRCGGCPEYSNCGFYKSLMKNKTLEEQIDVEKRYDIYNAHREKVKTKKKEN